MALKNALRDRSSLRGASRSARLGGTRDAYLADCIAPNGVESLWRKVEDHSAKRLQAAELFA